MRRENGHDVEPRGCLVCGVLPDDHEQHARGHAYVDPLRKQVEDYREPPAYGALIKFFAVAVACAALLVALRAAGLIGP